MRDIDRGPPSVNIVILRSTSHHVQCLNSQQLFYYIISLNKKATTTRNIYILGVVALDETNISSCLHFSMQNIEMSCDLDRASRWSNVNVSRSLSLFINVRVMPFTYRHNVMYTSLALWLFPHRRYKSNILFYKDNWQGWVNDDEVNLIDNIECKYKIENHILSLLWMMKNISYFNVSEKTFRLHRH